MADRSARIPLKAALARVWRNNRRLSVVFLFLVALSLFFAVRSIAFFVYWHDHRDEPIEGWMTIRYVANSYRVDPRLLHDTLGLERGQPDRRPLFEIARSRGLPLDVASRKLIEAIEADRRQRDASPQPPAPGS